MTKTPSLDLVKGAARPRPRSPWNDSAKRLLQAEMSRHGVTYKELARLLEARGETESASALITRVNRGTFSLAFFLQAVTAMGTRSIDLSHIATAVEKRKTRT